MALLWEWHPENEQSLWFSRTGTLRLRRSGERTRLPSSVRTIARMHLQSIRHMKQIGVFGHTTRSPFPNIQISGCSTKALVHLYRTKHQFFAGTFRNSASASARRVNLAIRTAPLK